MDELRANQRYRRPLPWANESVIRPGFSGKLNHNARVTAGPEKTKIRSRPVQFQAAKTDRRRLVVGASEVDHPPREPERIDQLQIEFRGGTGGM